MRKSIATLILTLLCSMAAIAEVNPNFHIYLCLGQSNMEGNGQIEPVDKNNVPERFKMMAAVNYNDPQRQMYNWYTAVPPLVRQGTGLSPADWFGRTMVDNLSEDVTVGVVMVAVGGCRIEHLDKDFDPATLANEADWFKSFMAAYDNKPYERLVACAKEAQKQGVIKGILLHQGESNNCQTDWPVKVKKVYNDLLTDLGLEAANVPLLAGQLVTKDMGGVCWGHNAIINTLPEVIPTAHVISAANLPNKGDGLHFTSHAYRVLGCRYASEMLKTMGIENPVVNYSEEEPYVPKPEPSEGDYVFDLKRFDPQIWEKGTFDAATGTFIAGTYGFGGWEFETPIDLSGYRYLVAELAEPQTNGAAFRVFDTASYWEAPFSADFNEKTLIVAPLDGMMKTLSDNSIVAVDTKKIYRIGFWAYGGKPIVIKQVFATNVDPYSAVSMIGDEVEAEPIYFSLQGLQLAAPLHGNVCIVKKGNKSAKVLF